jgi:integrase
MSYPYHAWRRAVKDAGLEGKIPHDFRRTAVRNLVRAGVPERVAMMITGHKTRSIFDRYQIVSPGDLQEAARKIDKAASVSVTPENPLSPAPITSILLQGRENTVSGKMLNS